MRFPSLFTLGLIAASWLWSNPTAHAQLTGITIEPVLIHDASIDPSLEGYTTYRIYADLTSNTDFVSAVFGDASTPLVLGCTGNIYQSDGVNFNFANEVNPLFFAAFPAWEYDSWFTIGSENSNGTVNVQNSSDQLAGALALFNAGEGFVIQDPIGASWFNVFPCFGQPVEVCVGESLAFGGEDNRVLIAQITATGDVYGIFNIQVFPNGVQENQVLSFGQSFSTNPTDVFGCTNPDADNYNTEATLDDLSCVLPCTLDLEVTNVRPPSCNGDNDALIQVAASGAQGADDYYLNAIEGPLQNFGNFGGLIAGSYTAYVVDAAGCMDSLIVEVPVTEAVELVVGLTAGVSCHDTEDAVLSIFETTGGSGEYEYYISNNTSVLTTQTEWTGLAGGQTLSIYAIDSNQCIGQSEPIAIQAPTEISVGFSPNSAVVDASCANTPDGEIYLVAYGGSAPETIQFSVDGETYGPSPLMVSAGTYTVTAQDVNGCTATMEEAVVVGPQAIDVNAISLPESCPGSEDGEVSWAPGGGQGTYTYTFNGEATPETAVSGIAPGTYEVTVTDSDGCTETESVEVDAAVPIQVVAEVADASCFGVANGEVQIYAFGGTEEFQYSDNGLNFVSNDVFGALSAGFYSFFVQDENGCVVNVDIEVGEPSAIEITAIVSEGSLDGEGSMDVTVSGGALPYTYAWTGNGVTGQDTQDLDGISTGQYTLEVTDGAGCTNQETFSITTSALGCTDSAACNYAPNASIDDGSCDYSCYGCTDVQAFNFAPEATIDDGSCYYFTPGCASIGEEGWETFATGVYPQGIIEREFGIPTTLDFVLHLADLVEEPTSGQSFVVSSFEPIEVIGLPSGLALDASLGSMGANEQQCVGISGAPSQEGVFEVEVLGDLTISLFGAPYVIGSYSFVQTLFIFPNVNGIPGCMYAFASNYNAIATYDDGSCFLEGCQDPSACNYNPSASLDSGQCDYGCLGCTYVEADNYEVSATQDDGTCTFSGHSGDCMFDANGDQYVGSGDLLDFLSLFGTTCE